MYFEQTLTTALTPEADGGFRAETFTNASFKSSVPAHDDIFLQIFDPTKSTDYNCLPYEVAVTGHW